MNYEIQELANNIIVQPKLKIVIHSWLIHSSIYYLWLIPDELDTVAAWRLVFRGSTTSTCICSEVVLYKLDGGVSMYSTVITDSDEDPIGKKHK